MDIKPIAKLLMVKTQAQVRVSKRCKEGRMPGNGKFHLGSFDVRIAPKLGEGSSGLDEK